MIQLPAPGDANVEMLLTGDIARNMHSELAEYSLPELYEIFPTGRSGVRSVWDTLSDLQDAGLPKTVAALALLADEISTVADFDYVTRYERDSSLYGRPARHEIGQPAIRTTVQLMGGTQYSIGGIELFGRTRGARWIPALPGSVLIQNNIDELPPKAVGHRPLFNDAPTPERITFDFVAKPVTGTVISLFDRIAASDHK